MRDARRLPSQVLREMRKIFFDVSADGVLIYQDPIIGALRNTHQDLTVIANAPKNRLDLIEHDCVVQTFELTAGTQSACERAFAAYFVAYERLCRELARDSKAA